MSGKNRDEDLDYYTKYATDDWVPLHNVAVAVNGHLGKGATFDQIVEATVDFVGELVDRGIRPGDLITDYPDFVPWSGEKSTLLDRLRNEMRTHGDFPYPGDVCWLHKPTAP
ncbi:hypothetical protein [Prauserella muralis]|uniref:hypothetical protein n=1 Tax=Prauserella muralis TaxID=588067 RepID=UPI0011ACB43C|nr:hypothetical protein [Prauserella muralis]TWE22912.1 hypothetical protein FHX69_4168 [Prauserella muralis]